MEHSKQRAPFSVTRNNKSIPYPYAATNLCTRKTRLASVVRNWIYPRRVTWQFAKKEVSDGIYE